MDTSEQYNQINIMLNILFPAWDEGAQHGFVEMRYGALPKINKTVSFQLPGTISPRHLIERILALYSECEERKENVYIGRSLREQAGYGSREHITVSGAMSFDIDPIRPEGSPASDSEHQLSLAVARGILGGLGEYACYLVSTGNGYQIWVPISPVCDIRWRQTVWEDACKNWSESIIEASGVRGLESYQGVHIDPQYDCARIVKALGGRSFKGYDRSSDDRPLRYATHVESYGSERLGSECIWSYASKKSDVVGRAAVIHGVSSEIPASFYPILDKDRKLQLSWIGSRDDIEDRTGSGQDCALVQRLKLHGFNPAECYAILSKSPGGKKRGNPQYWDHTVRKVFGL